MMHGMLGLRFRNRGRGPGRELPETEVLYFLGPFWSRRLKKDEFVAYQASSRGGVLRVRVAGERVYLSGQAVTVLRGELLDQG